MASGNMKYWLVVSREELIGIENDHFVSFPVLASSESEDQPSQGKHLDLFPSKTRFGFYLGKMMNRGDPNKPQDPYVKIRQSPSQCVYAEGSKPWANEILKAQGGMDVFIRKQ